MRRAIRYYLDSLTGDGPELMPLDSSLFNDLIEIVGRHVSATRLLPETIEGAVSAEPLGLGRKVSARWADANYKGTVIEVTSANTRKILYDLDQEEIVENVNILKDITPKTVRTGPMPNPDKFSMSTPGRAWETMRRCAALVPSERIIADIDRFDAAVEAIIKADGAYVPDKDLRNGRRKAAQRAHCGGFIIPELLPSAEAALAEMRAGWAGLSGPRK